MSKKHPIIAVTGSSGANRRTVRETFEKLCIREKLLAAYVQGDGFHRYDRAQMTQKIAEAAENGDPHISHFSPKANLFDKQEALYQYYGETGCGRRRFYLHNWQDTEPFKDLGLGPGEFSPWEDLPDSTDMLVYEGLHGWISADGVNLAPYVDLKIGVVPVVDTSDPIIARDIPTPDESLVVIRFKDPAQFNVDFPYLLQMLDGSWMSRRNSIVVTGGKMGLAMELIMTPILQDIMEERRQLLKREAA